MGANQANRSANLTRVLVSLANVNQFSKLELELKTHTHTQTHE